MQNCVSLCRLFGPTVSIDLSNYSHYNISNVLKIKWSWMLIRLVCNAGESQSSMKAFLTWCGGIPRYHSITLDPPDLSGKDKRGMPGWDGTWMAHATFWWYLPQRRCWMLAYVITVLVLLWFTLGDGEQSFLPLPPALNIALVQLQI